MTVPIKNPKFSRLFFNIVYVLFYHFHLGAWYNTYYTCYFWRVGINMSVD